MWNAGAGVKKILILSFLETVLIKTVSEIYPILEQIKILFDELSTISKEPSELAVVAQLHSEFLIIA